MALPSASRLRDRHRQSTPRSRPGQNSFHSACPDLLAIPDDISNLQEFFDGTDPMNAASAGAPADLTPPQIIITPGNGGTLNLNWVWPEQYAGKVKFDLHTTDALGQPFSLAPDLIQYLGGGNYQLNLPNNGAVKFFRLQLSLK